MVTDIWIGKVTLNHISDNGYIIDSSVKKLTIRNITSEYPYNFAFNSADNKFYAAGAMKKSGETGPHLFEIDVATGATVDKGQSGDPNASFWGMQFDSNGVIWGGDVRLNSATVAGWTSPTDLQRTAAFSTFPSYDMNALFIASSSSTSPAAPTLNTVTGGD